MRTLPANQELLRVGTVSEDLMATMTGRRGQDIGEERKCQAKILNLRDEDDGCGESLVFEGKAGGLARCQHPKLPVPHESRLHRELGHEIRPRSDLSLP